MKRYLSGLLLTGLLAACTETPPTHFYTLSTQPPADAPVAGDKTDGLVLALAPIGLPDYLNRPQLIVRLDETRMDLADLDNWIEPLDTLIQRTMAVDMQSEPGIMMVLRLPERRQSAYDYGIEVNFTRFESNIDGMAWLDADWTMVDAMDAEIARQHVSRQITVEDPADKASHVRALSQLIEDLNTTIMQALPAPGS
ncbi:MAG: PqiC family protein [Geminicoccaceae bacterium]